jgi:NAD(P)H-dependent flavin oxidoreductase YrpB (nitropropane dioxygenase family)
LQARQANGAVRHLKAIKEGDEKDGFLFAGQCVGGIKDVPNCKDLIERIVAEAEKKIESAWQNVNA